MSKFKHNVSLKCIKITDFTKNSKVFWLHCILRIKISYPDLTCQLYYFSCLATFVQIVRVIGLCMHGGLPQAKAKAISGGLKRIKTSVGGAVYHMFCAKARLLIRMSFKSYCCILTY